MATTTTLPPRPTRLRRLRWLGIAVVVLVIGVAAVLLFNRFSRNSTRTAPATTDVVRGSVTASVSGSGAVAAAQSLELPFQTSGIVTEVLVQAGDNVSAGQVLARLDDRDLRLQVTSAEASLESAKAKMAQAQQGNATPQEITSARASVTSAEANLQKTRTGNTTAADIASAEASLRSAQAKLAELKAGPTADTLSSAKAKLEQARATLESQRNSLSAAKTKAQSQLEQAANTLRTKQDDYSRTYWANREQERQLNQYGKELPQENKDEEAAALRAVQDAEEGLKQAQVGYDQAVEAERTGLATAESQVRDATEQLRVTQQGATQAEIIQAQASVDQAQASLQKLRQGGTAADVTAAQASVDQAKANLSKLTAPATETDLQVQQAAMTQAEQSVQQAKLKLEQATLKAPFAGIVTAVNVVPGSNASSGTAAFSLIDRSTLHVDLKLSENDVAKVQLKQPVALTIDALKGWQTDGVVSYIAPSAETSNSVVTYAVRVSFPDSDPRVKVGMTANLMITTAQQDAVLLVPNSALLPKGAGHAVRVLNPDDRTTREVDVETGLSDGTQTAITSGLNEGDKVVTTPTTTQTTNRGGGFFRP